MYAASKIVFNGENGCSRKNLTTLVKPADIIIPCMGWEFKVDEYL